MAMLLSAQKIAGSPDFKIPHGNLESRSQVCKLPDRGQPFFRNFPEELISPVKEKGISHSVRAPYPSPQLIELG